jgi:hypothetical protein
MSKRTIAVVKAELDTARAGKHIDALITPEHIALEDEYHALLSASTDMLAARLGSIHARRMGRLH